MLDEIKELRRMLDYTMCRYNDLLERVEKLERNNTPMYFVTQNDYDTRTHCNISDLYNERIQRAQEFIG